MQRLSSVIALICVLVGSGSAQSSEDNDFNRADVTPMALTLFGNVTENSTGSPNETNSDNIQQITSGSDTYRRKYPYIAVILVYYYYSYFQACTGVIYDRHTVITTAHCLSYYKYRYYTYYVAVGVNDLSRGVRQYGAQLIKVDSYTIHPGWDPHKPGFPNNLGLLHLDCFIDYNYFVKPAPLATRYHGKFVNEECYIAGWGYTRYGKPYVLQEAYVYSLSNYYCSLFWKISYKAKILGTHICSYRYPVSACFGDGGGPLVCNNKVAGIISWGRKDCSGCSPTVSTRISKYLRWIRVASQDD